MNWQKYNQRLIKQLRQEKAIFSPAVIRAFEQVPRHHFAPHASLEAAYKNQVIGVKEGADGRSISTLSQPAMIGIMLEQLQLQPGQRVLEIGAGTGYNAALMSAMVGPEGHVTTIDIESDLVEQAQAHLEAAQLEAGISVIAGDGALGYPAHAPFDRIILTVSAWDVAPAWLAQIAPGGRMVAPLIFSADNQFSIAFDWKGKFYESDSMHRTRFVTLRGGFQVPDIEQAWLLPGQVLLDNIIGTPPVALQQVQSWLEDGFRLYRSEVKATADALYYDFAFFLETCAAPAYQLFAFENGIEAQFFPPAHLYRESPESNTLTRVESCALLRADSMAVLGRADAPPSKNSELLIGRYGEKSAASEMLEAIRTWDKLGQPSSQHSRIWIFPATMHSKLPPGYVEISRPQSRWIIHWGKKH